MDLEGKRIAVLVENNYEWGDSGREPHYGASPC